MTQIFSHRTMCSMLAALGLIAVAGCSEQQDIQQLNQNEFTLRGMIASDHQKIDAQDQQIKQLHDEITELQHGASTGGSSDQISSLSDRVGKLESEVNALQVGMANSPGGAVPPPSGVIGGAPAGTVAPAGGGDSAAAPEPAPTWPQDLDKAISDAQSSDEKGAKTYRELLQAMKDGNYKLVLVRFNDLQHRYPKSALIEPAEYFTANALYEMKDYGRAIIQFNDLVQRYPEGPYASQSLLRQAQAFLHNGNDYIDAKLTLDMLVSKHPDAPEVPAAKQMLKAIAS